SEEARAEARSARGAVAVEPTFREANGHSGDQPRRNGYPSPRDGYNGEYVSRSRDDYPPSPREWREDYSPRPPPSRDEYPPADDYASREEYAGRDEYAPREDYPQREEYSLRKPPREEYRPRTDDYGADTYTPEDDYGPAGYADAAAGYDDRGDYAPE